MKKKDDEREGERKKNGKLLDDALRYHLESSDSSVFNYETWRQACTQSQWGKVTQRTVSEYTEYKHFVRLLIKLNL